MEQDTEKKCKSCEHDCHCDTLVCVECQCGGCNCAEEPKRPDWG